MIVERDATYLTDLVHNLRQMPQELEWVEFKVNQATEAPTIGEYISALANGAALNGEEVAYMLWGIKDGSHAIVGTEFKPATAKQGNEPLESWLRRGLTPRIDFRFHEVVIDEKRVVVLELSRQRNSPLPSREGNISVLATSRRSFETIPKRNVLCGTFPKEQVLKME